MHRILQQLPDLELPIQIRDLLERAARWHDLGKAHQIFQETMRRKDCPDLKEQWAKSPHISRHSRKGFRHELASALAAWHQGEHFLVVYLVACHHGKVRLSLEPLPWEHVSALEEPYMSQGVIEREELPEVNLGDQILAVVEL